MTVAAPMTHSIPIYIKFSLHYFQGKLKFKMCVAPKQAHCWGSTRPTFPQVFIRYQMKEKSGSALAS